MICQAEIKEAGELSPDIVKLRIAGIDWSFVGKKLSMQGFEQDAVQKIMADYFKFLILFGVVGNRVKLVPWGSLDKAWHEHILHTPKYKEDCGILFSCFLHHNPDIEFASDEHLKNTEETRLVYEKYFREPMPDFVE